MCCEAEATMHDSRPVHGLPGWLQTAGPAGGDERPAHGESPLSSPPFFFFFFRWRPRPRPRICLGSTSRLTLVFGSAESGARQGNVSAQEQHWKGPFLSEAEIGESHSVQTLPWETSINSLLTQSNCPGVWFYMIASPLPPASPQIKLVNINIPDIIDGKPSIILGLIWTIILQYHVSLGSHFSSGRLLCLICILYMYFIHKR